MTVPPMTMSRVRIVLVRPQIAGNIGSVARVMENFAAGALYLVAPEAAPLDRRALERSTRGEHRLRDARMVATISEGLEGAVYAIGATRRVSPAHQAQDMPPWEMARVVHERAAEGDVALLFGQEDNGLSREDLLACDAVVQIPAAPDYPTLNLAHAVAVCLYEVFVAGLTGAPPRNAATASPGDLAEPAEGRRQTAHGGSDEGAASGMTPARPRQEPADGAMMARLMHKLQHALLTIGYLRPEKPDHLMFPIRHILSRAGLTRAEAQILMGLAQQIDEFARYERPADPPPPRSE